MIKCGVDLVRVARLAEVNTAIRARFIRRVYTQAEQQQARDDNQTLAALFACKEAASKALGTGIGKVGWQDFEILHMESGEPIISLGGLAKTIAERKGLTDWAVSITHENGLAVAMVVAQG